MFALPAFALPAGAWGLLALAVAALAGCGPRPMPAHPALWVVSGPHGERAWLFGTIHALPAPVAWRTPAVRAALAQAGEVMVEIARLDDGAGLHAAFVAAAGAPHPALPPLAARVPAADRAALASALARAGVAAHDLNTVPTWAAALELAAGDTPGTDNGIDRALIADHGPAPVVELEGAPAQFAAFAALPEASQRRLLVLAVRGGGHAAAEARALATAWAAGDMATLGRAAEGDFAGDPVLRAGLADVRNRRWAGRIAAAMAAGRRPFVAVGAAHMAGAAGLPALLTRGGWRVTRVE